MDAFANLRLFLLNCFRFSLSITGTMVFCILKFLDIIPDEPGMCWQEGDGCEATYYSGAINIDGLPGEEIHCNLTRADQQGEDVFICEAYEPK